MAVDGNDLSGGYWNSETLRQGPHLILAVGQFRRFVGTALDRHMHPQSVFQSRTEMFQR